MLIDHSIGTIQLEKVKDFIQCSHVIRLPSFHLVVLLTIEFDKL